MRPELEDFDELNAAETTPRSGAMSWLVLAVAVGGFTTLAYYAYHSGSQSMQGGTLTVVNAEEGPIKTAPADPGGEQFPNKDKTIYNAIANEDSGKPHAEKLLPEAEHPVVPEESAEDDALMPSPTAAAPVPANPTGNAPAAMPAPAANASASVTLNADAGKEAKPDVVKVAPLAVDTVTSKNIPAPTTYVNAAVKTDAEAGNKATEGEATATDATGTASAPTMVNVKPATAQSKPTSEAKDDQAAAKKAAKAGKKEAKAKPAAGSVKIQLGAFKSEAEAQAQWKKIAAKNSDVLGGAPIIVKADLPNGTFYRLRTTVADAKTACAKLAARKQACFPAGK